MLGSHLQNVIRYYGMGRFVLVDDEQVPLSPREVADAVEAVGAREAGAKYGFSSSTIRLFLKRNGYIAQRQVTLFKAPQVPVPDGDPDLPF